MIFIIEHPNAAFNGVAGGIDFVNGIGSTSSRQDAERVAKAIGGRFGAADVPPEASGPGAGSPDKTPAGPVVEKPKRAGGRKPK